MGAQRVSAFVFSARTGTLATGHCLSGCVSSQQSAIYALTGYAIIGYALAGYALAGYMLAGYALT